MFNILQLSEHESSLLSHQLSQMFKLIGNDVFN